MKHAVVIKNADGSYGPYEMNQPEINAFDPDTQDELRKLGITNEELAKKKASFTNLYGQAGIVRYKEYIMDLKKKAKEVEEEKVKASLQSKSLSEPTPTASPQRGFNEQTLLKRRNEFINLYGNEKGEKQFQIFLDKVKDIEGFDEVKRRFDALPENAARSALQPAPTTTTSSTPPQATTLGGMSKKSGGLNKFIEEVNSSAKKAKIAAEDVGVPKSNKRELIVDAGDQYDPETGKLISPEKINLLVAQETARRLANKPYEPNPYNRSAQINELEANGFRVLNDLVQEGMNPRSSVPFQAKEGIGAMALDRFADQDSRYKRTMTLKDRLISDIRANAQARLQDSFHDMGMKLSSQKIGRSGIDDLLKVRMTENMNRQLNELDSKMAYDMMAQQNQLAGQETEFAMRQDEQDHKKALDQYRLNKIEEEARKEEQRKNALNAVSQGSALRQTDQEDLNRKAQEFDRKNHHHDTQVDSYIRRVNEARIGAPAQILPDRIQGFAPTHMQGVQPGQLARMPLAGGEPIITPSEPDTTKKDIASALAAGTGLYLKNKEIDKMK